MNFDIEAYLKSRNINYRTRGKNVSSGWIGIECFNHPDHSNHLGIHLESGTLNCWHCGSLGNYKNLIKEIDNCSWREVEKICKEFEKDDIGEIIQEPAAILPPRTRLKFPKEFKKQIPQKHKEYLKNRNFDYEHLTRKYDLYFSELYGDYKFRVIAPIYMDGKMVSFVGRDVTDKQGIPYLYCKDENAVISRRELIYNLDSVDDVAIFVEGITDVWNIGDGCVGLLSMQFTKAQIWRIREKQIKKGYILLDRGESEERKAEMLEAHLSFIPEIYHLELPEYADDPGKLSKEDVEELRNKIFS